MVVDTRGLGGGENRCNRGEVERGREREDGRKGVREWLGFLGSLS